MTNQEAYKILFDYPHSYDELSDSIYYYPCDDLHGMFSGHDCNCRKQIKRKYLSQEEINKRVDEYLLAKESNIGLYLVSVKMQGRITVSPCKSNNIEKQNTVFHWGGSDDYSVYCKESDIEKSKRRLISLCIAKHDEKINKATKDKEYFLNEVVSMLKG